MSDEGQAVESESHVLRYVLLAVAVIYIIVSLFLINDLRGRVAELEGKEKVSEVAQKQIQEKLHITDEQMRAAVEELGSKVGMTREEIAKRATELKRQQQQAEERLTAEQQKTQQAVGQVSGEVSGVKTELGGAKTDIATNKQEIESTKAQLQKAIGDLGVQSGLIARTHSELEELKHKGDRNYFEFTLAKKKRVPVSTISLELKKADRKHGKFTLYVMADDRTIEKKDRTMNEPLQFYTGRDRRLYEIVIYKVEKNSVTGYLSTPKS